MTLDARIAALDTLTQALTNQWHDGRWSWWNPSPCGGSMFPTRQEAIDDLLAWSQRIVKKQRTKKMTRISLEVSDAPI